MRRVIGRTYASIKDIVGYTTSTLRCRTYNQLSSSDIDFFRSLLGSGSLVTAETALRDVNSSKLALKPKTTQEVSQILQYCNSRKLAVVPQAGNSGLCGGSVPLFDEIVLLTGEMNKVIAFDAVSGSLTCQAGCTLAFLGDYVGQRGFDIPLDLGAKECQAGGFISTNAGGLRVIRFGPLRGSVLGIEAVTPDGTVLDLLQPLRKNNTGYDLKQLFIGGEGTLGVVTAVSILCPVKRNSIHVAWLACSSYDAVQQRLDLQGIWSAAMNWDTGLTLVHARKHLAEILSAFEFIDGQALHFTLRELQESVSNPTPRANNDFYVLMETAGSNAQHDREKLEAFMKSIKEQGLFSHSIIAHEKDHIRQIWHLREHISVALSQKGPVYKYDLSLPVSEIYELVQATRNRLSAYPEAEVVAYGHLGDGNIHLNVSVPQLASNIQQILEPFVYDFCSQRGGSISAEHGLGQMKNIYIRYSKPEPAIHLMARLKHQLDPNKILNPYKLLPSDYWKDERKG